MEEYPSIPMENTVKKIMRRSIYTFLQNYQYFTTISALLAFPFSSSVLLSQALVSSLSLLPTIQNHLQSIFHASGLPPSSEFFTILSLKFSQTIISSILVLPFTLSLLLIAKCSVIRAFTHKKPSLRSRKSLSSARNSCLCRFCPQNTDVVSVFLVFRNHDKQVAKEKPFCCCAKVCPPFLQSKKFPYFISLYNDLLHTQLCNSFFILSVNSTCFSILFLALNCFIGFGFSSPNSLLFLSATGALLYSIILANAVVICNLSLVLSGFEKFSGFLTILKARVLIRGRSATALSLAVLVNMAMAAVEALFQYRVVRAYHHPENFSTTFVALEGMFIAYLYSILIVIDTIVGCVFFQSCKTVPCIYQKGIRLSYQLGNEERSSNSFVRAKTLVELP